jgi:hypothetical protein
MAEDKKINCRVLSAPGGGRRLVFTIDGTNKCVGELRVNADPQYLLVMSQMFSQYVAMERRMPIAPSAPLPSAIRSILNGHAANQG